VSVFKAKMHQIQFPLGLRPTAPDPGGAYSVPPDFLAKYIRKVINGLVLFDHVYTVLLASRELSRSFWQRVAVQCFDIQVNFLNGEGRDAHLSFGMQRSFGNDWSTRVANRSCVIAAKLRDARASNAQDVSDYTRLSIQVFSAVRS